MSRRWEDLRHGDTHSSDHPRRWSGHPVLPYWINAGVYLIDTRTFPLFPDKGDHEDSTFPELAKDGRLFAHRIDGYWRGIDTVKDVIVAGEEAVRHGFALGEEFRITS